MRLGAKGLDAVYTSNNRHHTHIQGAEFPDSLMFIIATLIIACESNFWNVLYLSHTKINTRLGTRKHFLLFFPI